MPTATYEELLIESLPQVIETEAQYRQIVRRFGDFVGTDLRTDLGRRRGAGARSGIGSSVRPRLAAHRRPRPAAKSGRAAFAALEWEDKLDDVWLAKASQLTWPPASVGGPLRAAGDLLAGS